LYWTILGTALLLVSTWLNAAAKSGAGAPAPDRIDVIAHFPLSGGPVTQLTTGTHWQKNYLYLNNSPTGAVTIPDVTNPAAPAVAGELDVPPQEAHGSLRAVVGTAALVATPGSTPATRTATQTITVLSFVDPEHPTVAHQFSGVTAMLNDSSRGLIYLSNSDGLWVLRVKPGEDIQADKDYAQYLRNYR
jgi:hypothetical protein